MATVHDSAVVGAHLVGSVPLGSSEEVFEVVADELGRHVKRIPDGETGERAGWAGWAALVFWRTPGLEERHPFYKEISPRTIGLADGVSAADIEYPRVGYADAALASYEQFAQRKRDGAIAADVRFLVSLATPLALASCAVAASELAALEPGFEQSQLDELQLILDAIPHDQLAIQWDVCIEVWLLEGWVDAPFDPVGEGIAARLKRYAEAIPDDVELGFHFCYGDYQHAHLGRPADCRACVDIFTAAAELIDRSIEWIHVPVPIDRDDDAFFAPLDALALAPSTELYVGLIHHGDGIDGARRRIEAARRHVAGFGVGTECGFGRRPPETIAPLLELHAAVADLATA